MSRARKEFGSANDAAFTLTGTWGVASDGNASGGSYVFAAAGGAAATIAVPAGVTCVLLGTVLTSAARTGTVAVDGTVIGTWTQYANTTLATFPGGGTPTALYRALYAPIFLGAGAHTIVVTQTSGNFALDFADFYTADATPANPGQLTAFGHSIVAGGQGAGAQQATNALRFTGRVAAALGLTEVNHGQVGESLSFISDPNATPNVPAPSAAFGNIQSGWQRIDAGSYSNGAGTSFPWELSSPAVAILMEGLNDIDFGPHGGGGATPAATEPTPGYYRARYKQRLREAIWRMMANCPQTICAVCGVAPTVDLTAPDAEKQAWNADIAAVCNEASMAGYPLFVDVWPALANAIAGPPRIAATYPNALFADALHPHAAGHALLADAVLAAIRGRRATNARLLGIW